MQRYENIFIAQKEETLKIRACNVKDCFNSSTGYLSVNLKIFRPGITVKSSCFSREF